MIKKLLPSIGEYKWQTILAPLTIILEVFLEVSIPTMMSNIIDEGINLQNMDAVWKYGGIIIAMAIGSLISGALSARFSSVAAAGFAKNLRLRLFEKVQDFSFYNVDRFSSASLVTRLTTDVANIQNAFLMSIRIAIRAPIMFISALVMAFRINWKITMIFVAVIPALAIVAFFIIRLVFPLFSRMFKLFDNMNKRVQENLTAIRVVKAYVREGHETEEFRKASAEVQAAQKKAEKVIVFASPLAMGGMYLCMLLVLFFGGKSIIKGQMEAGQLTAFITYCSQILTSLMMVTIVAVSLVMSVASAKRITEVLDEKIDITDENADKDLKVADGSISFKNVDFSYFKDENNLILKDFNLDIKSGETVGIIGSTGSAKTTVVNLILRLYDVTAGSVEVGGRNVKDYTLRNLRDSAAMVLQKNVLFSGTIKENLLWGNPDATDEQVVAACKNAAADDFIRSFPMGYDTVMGQGGVNVSGGQKQRLCIARALLKNPKIMILDDSTSAVDTATDAQIRNALKKNLSDTTVIIIAQRLTSVKDADKILVLNEGQIDGIGTHDELMATNEVYREIYDSQQKGAED